MPDGLVGEPSTDAQQAVADAGLEALLDPEASDTVPDGDVIQVDPGEGATVDQGSTVTIVVSTGTAAGGGDADSSTPAGATTDPTPSPSEAAREADAD